MSQDEVLKDNTIVLWEWNDRGRWRVTFVDGFPKLEQCVGGVWCMAMLTREGHTLLHAFTVAHVALLRSQMDRARAEIELADYEQDRPRSGRWAYKWRRIEAIVRSFPAPWNDKGRSNR